MKIFSIISKANFYHASTIEIKQADEIGPVPYKQTPPPLQGRPLYYLFIIKKKKKKKRDGGWVILKNIENAVKM